MQHIHQRLRTMMKHTYDQFRLWLIGLLPPTRVVGVLLVLHLWLAGCGMVAWLRSERALLLAMALCGCNPQAPAPVESDLAVLAQGASGYAQAEPGATGVAGPALVEPHEALEDLLPIGVRYPGAIVGHGDDHRVALVSKHESAVLDDLLQLGRRRRLFQVLYDLRFDTIFTQQADRLPGLASTGVVPDDDGHGGLLG